MSWTPAGSLLIGGQCVWRNAALAAANITTTNSPKRAPKRIIPAAPWQTKTVMKSIGWGTWIRTKIDGVRVRCSTVELSPNGRPKARFRAWAWRVNSEARRAAQALRAGGRAVGSSPAASRAKAWRLAVRSDLLHRHHSWRGLERAGDGRANRIAAGQADFDLALLRPEDHD